MVATRNVVRGIDRLRHVKTWQLALVLILMCFISATLLRLNNVGMGQRWKVLQAADVSGDDIAIHARLYDLQRYSAGHMNASTGTFFLKGQYERDAKKIIETAQADSEGTGANAKAESVCKPQFTGYSSAYLECFIRELDKYPTSEELPEIKAPVPALYQYSFVSPVWTPDMAGIAVLISVLVALVIIGRMIAYGVLYLILKLRYREV